MSDDKPFPPSAKRLKKLTSEGNVVRCKAVTFALGWCTTGLVLAVFIPLEFLRELIHCVENGSEASGIQHSIGLGVRRTVYAVVVAVGAPGLLNVFAELFLARWSVAPRALRFAPQRLSFVSGFNRFGGALRSSPMTFARHAIALGSVGFILISIAGTLPELVVGDERSVALAMNRWVRLTWGVGVALLVCCACVEYITARRRYLRDNGMSFEEVRQEQKEEEGDPHVRAERRAIHEWLARGDISERVKRSKVILIGTKRKKRNDSKR